MEHTIMMQDCEGLTLYTEDDKPTELSAYTYNHTVSFKLNHEQELALVKALLLKILERGDLDAPIKTWISHNELDGDPLDDCGNAQLTYGPEALYEAVYDCIEGIMEK